MSDVPTSKTVPQAATSLLAVCIQAIRIAPLGEPVSEWLKAKTKLNDPDAAARRRQVASLLLFLGLLREGGRLEPEIEAWRSDRGTMAEGLAQRFREGYVAAGCAKEHASLLGNSLVTAEALGRVLEGEPPFLRLENLDTRRNAIRFVCHVHQRICSQETLIPEDRDNGDARPAEASRAESKRSAERTAPAWRDLGTIVNPQRYRVARLSDDRWVWGMVHFESLQGAADSAWLDGLDAAEQARWLEQLAAALLDEADALRCAQGTVSWERPRGS